MKKPITHGSSASLLFLAMSLGSTLHAQTGTFSSSASAPTVTGTDIANFATQTGTDKWFFQTNDETNPSDAAKGQTFITGSTAVKLKALTYKIGSGSKDAQTTYKVRVGTVSGSTFTQIYTETITQTVDAPSSAFMTWRFGTPPTLSPNTTYAIDVGMDSAVTFTTGVPNLAYTANISNARIGSYYDSGDRGAGNATVTFTTARDRVFHLDLEDLQVPSPDDGATVPSGNVVLSWTNLPAITGTNVWVDVWFGTSASALTKVVSAAQNLRTHTVSAPTAATYFWRVDTYRNGVATGTPTTGATFDFVVTDTDGDGMPDTFERLHTSPASGTALNPGDDLDSDGLTNIQEFQRNTLPRDNDTDNDTLLDGPELSGVGSRPATSPTDSDSDNDTLNDGVESNTGIWVSSSDRGTNPTKSDTDGDGLSDSAETNSGSYTSASNTGTSPLSKDSDGDSAEDWYEVAASYTNPTQATSKPNIPYPLPDPSTSSGSGTKPVKVFILSGQSNMVGFGRVGGSGNDTLQSVTQTEKKFPNLITSTNTWTVRNDVLYRGVISALGDAALRPGFGESSDSFGPELGFGHAIGYILDEPVLIIKASNGNRSLGWDYLPPGSTSYTHEGTTYAGYGNYSKTGSGTTPGTWYAGKQYDDSFLHENDMGARAWASGLAYVIGSQVKHNGVTYASKTNHTSSSANSPVPAGNASWSVYSIFNVCDILDNFAAEYPQWATRGFEIGGFGWFQGWNDGQSSDTEYAVRYEQNLARLIRQLRTYYNGRYPGKIQPTAPFVTVTCGFDGYEASGNRTTVVNAQLAVGNPVRYPEFAGNVKSMEGRGYWRTSGPNLSQNYHYYHNAETYMLVGDAMGRGMIDLLDVSTAPTTPQKYVWSQTAGGAQNWTTGANWTPSTAPSTFSGDTLDFSTVNTLADTTLTLGADRTAQTWTFGDSSGAQNWIVGSGNTITLAGTAPTINVTNNSTQIESIIAGNAGLVKAGAGTLILTATNTYTGATTISAGTLQIGNGSTTGIISTASTITNNGALIFQRSNGSTQGVGFANGIAGTGSLTNAGAGALTLNAANTYSGLTTISAGSIKALHANALGSTAAGTVVSGTTTGSPSNARLELEGGITVTSETLTVSGVGNFYGALSSTAGSNTWAGNITIGSSGTRLGCTTGNTLIISGIISSGVVETGITIRTQDLNSVVVYSGANTYRGDTTILVGKLQLAGGNDRIPTASRLVMGSSSTNPDGELDLNGRNQAVAGLTLSGTGSKNSVNNSSSTAATFTINSLSNTSFGGIIKGNLALTKTGASIQTLSGANTYTGTTTISAGRLALGTNNALPATPVSIGAATLDTATFTDALGTLSITDAAAINLGSGAALTFANSSAITWPGTLNITGTFVSGSSLRFGTTSTALTSTQLAKISSTGLTGFALDTNGFLTASSPSGYASWAAAHASTTTPTQDQDNDGVTNSVEYVLGGNSSINDAAKLPITSLSSGNILFSFQRAQASINASTSLTIQVTPALHAWPNNYAVGANTASSTAGVTVTPGLTAGFDTVTLSIPRAPDLSKFIRLQVTITP